MKQRKQLDWIYQRKVFVAALLNLIQQCCRACFNQRDHTVSAHKSKRVPHHFSPKHHVTFNSAQRQERNVNIAVTGFIEPSLCKRQNWILASTQEYSNNVKTLCFLAVLEHAITLVVSGDSCFQCAPPSVKPYPHTLCMQCTFSLQAGCCSFPSCLPCATCRAPQRC